MKRVLVAKLCLTLGDPMDCSPSGSSVHGIFQAGILEWVAIPFSSGSSWPRDWTPISYIAGKFFTPWATRETKLLCIRFSSVRFSRSVVSDSLWPHELQYARPPCASPTPRAHSNSCPLSRWCHPAISSSVVPTPPAPNPSQHQGLFRWVNSLHQVANVLEFHLQHPSFQWTPGTDLL